MSVTVIDARERDLGGFLVRRLLPVIGRRMVGPFIFFDHMGPVVFAPGEGMDVPPHPHIGLATVTYLFEGAIVHRDSLGSRQVIRPGDINWMTAGRGIVHSERTGAEERAKGAALHGLQLWVALPQADEEMAPAFVHHPAATLPEREEDGVRLRVLAGTAYGMTSPVATRSALFYVEAVMAAGTEVVVTDEHEERAVYVVEGAVTVGAQEAGPGRMVVCPPGERVAVHAHARARVVMLGGAPLDGERHVFWNFVSSRRARLEDAKRAWQDDAFPKVVGDDGARVPLPGQR